MPKQNPNELFTVTLTRDQIQELIEAARFTNKHNPTLKVAEKVLTRFLRQPKATQAANQEMKACMNATNQDLSL